jgi:iron(III) transport system substrate-binding protein
VSLKKTFFWSRTAWRAIGCLAALALLVFICLEGRARGAEARGDWESEWNKTVAGARKEGKLAVFLYQRDNIETAVKAFEKKVPEIQVTTASTPAAETGPRIMAERRAGKYLWDICICGPTTPLGALYPAKALDPIKPALILPEVLDQSKWFGAKHHYTDPEGKYIFVFLGTVEMPNLAYNKKLVDPKEFSSYWDLLSSKWRGKIVALDPRRPGRQRVQARIFYHVPELGPRFLQRLFSEAEVTLTRSDAQALDWLAVGKFPLCLFCGRVESAKAKGLPIDEFSATGWKDTPVLYSGSNGTVALMNQAPNPNAANLFINWLLSAEGQVSYQKIMNTPDLIAESMRTDISKDPVPQENRRMPGGKYVVLDTPERSDPAPVNKLLKEVIK